MNPLKKLSQVFVLGLFITITSMAQTPPPSSNPSINVAYKYSEPKAMYGYLDMTPIQSEEEAERFLKKGIFSAQVNQYTGIGIHGGGFSLMLWGMQRLSGVEDHRKNVFASYFSGLLWGVAYMSGFMEMFSDAANAPLHYIHSCIASLSSDELRSLEVQFLIKKHTIPERVRDDIGRRFFALRTGVEPYSSEAKKYLKTALSFPTSAIRPIFHKDQLVEAFDVYDPSVQDKLRAASWLLMRKNAALKQAFYFQGLPGTGKTYAAWQLAEGLGLPKCEIDLAGKSPQDLTGTPEKVGEIVQCMIDKQALNPVITFNDGDRALNNPNSGFSDFFLSLFDRERKTMKNAYLGWDVDVSQLTFM